MDVVTYHYPAVSLLLLLVPCGLLLASLVLLKHRLSSRRTKVDEADWSIPDRQGELGSDLFQGWDVRCKLVTLLLYAFLVASLQHLNLVLVALGVSLLALMLAGTPLASALLRVMALGGILGLFLLVLPFTVPARPGDVLLLVAGLEALPFNLRGLHLAATIATKGITIALLTEPFLMTTPLPAALQGLDRLGLPAMFGQLVMLSHRYLFVFSSEAQRMATAMRVRGFRNRTRLVTFRALGNFLGMLFIRSFERTERAVDAMRARGYCGRFPTAPLVRLRPRDLLMSGFWLVLGLALVMFDRGWL